MRNELRINLDSYTIKSTIENTNQKQQSTNAQKRRLWKTNQRKAVHYPEKKYHKR